METLTYREIKLKNGIVIPFDVKVDVRFKEGSTNCFITYLGQEYLVRITSVFDKPDDEQLQEWVSDSIVESVLGNNVEPDGYDEHGAPSWLIALGLI